MPFFLDWLQVDYTRIFLLQAWFVLWIVLLEFPTGIIADRYGRKISLALGAIFMGFDFLIFGLVRNYTILFIAEFLGAIGMTLISGADKALIFDSLLEMKKENSAKQYFSRYEAAGTSAIVLSFPVGSMIAGAKIIPYPDSLPVTFILSGIFSILALFFYITMHEPERHKPSESFVMTGINGLKYLRNHKVLRVFAANSVLISAITFFIFWFYQPLAGRAGIGVSYYGFIAAGFNLFATLLLFGVSRLENLFGMKNLLFYSALIPAAMFIALGMVTEAYFVLPAIFLIAGSKLLRAPILADFMNRHIESKDRATILSAVSLLEKLIITILYPLIGLLTDYSLSYSLLFLGTLLLIFAMITRIENAQISAAGLRL